MHKVSSCLPRVTILEFFPGVGSVVPCAPSAPKPQVSRSSKTVAALNAPNTAIHDHLHHLPSYAKSSIMGICRTWCGRCIRANSENSRTGDESYVGVTKGSTDNLISASSSETCCIKAE